MRKKRVRRHKVKFPIRNMMTLRKSIADANSIASEKTEARRKEKIGTVRLHENPGAPVAVNPAFIPMSIQHELVKYGRQFLTRNSKCPCNSQKRFKRCHMLKGVTA